MPVDTEVALAEVSRELLMQRALEHRALEAVKARAQVLEGAEVAQQDDQLAVHPQKPQLLDLDLNQLREEALPDVLKDVVVQGLGNPSEALREQLTRFRRLKSHLSRELAEGEEEAAALLDSHQEFVSNHLKNSYK